MSFNPPKHSFLREDVFGADAKAVIEADFGDMHSKPKPRFYEQSIKGIGQWIRRHLLRT